MNFKRTQPAGGKKPPGFETETARRQKAKTVREQVLGDELKGLQGRMEERKGIAETKLKSEEELRRIREATERNLPNFLSKLIYGVPLLGGIMKKIAEIFEAKADLNPDSVQKAIEDKIDDEITKGFDKNEFIIAHRALGFGKRENSREAITAALDKNEDQVEIDLRMYNGEIYVNHDPLSEKPVGKITLKECLEIFATHKNQNAAIYFEIKEPGILAKFDKAVAEIDAAHAEDPGYIPIAQRHFIASFSSEIIKEAYKRNPDRPLVFFYFPTKEYPFLKPAIRLLGRERIVNICKKIDGIAGTKFSKIVGNAQIKLGQESLDKRVTNPTDFVEFWDDLPKDPELLEALTKSKGYIGFSYFAATRELIKEAHGRGIKVMVGGVKDADVKDTLERLGPDMIVTDTPEALGKNPGEIHNDSTT